MNFLFNSSSANRPRRVSLALAFTVAIAIGLIQTAHGVAQDKTPAQPNLTQLQKNYSTSIADLRQAVKDLKRAGLRYFYSRSEHALEYKSQWQEAAVRGAKAYDDIHQDAFDLFLALQKPDEQLTNVVYRLNRNFLESGRLETNYRVTQKLFSMFPDDERIQLDMARVALLKNDFATAQSLAKSIPDNSEEFSVIQRIVWKAKDELAIEFERESKLRAQEAIANDLPRVELETTKGKIVLELFENEAPETVGNFISLVEAGFYDDLIFNYVLKNIVACSGVVSTQKKRQPIGYTIYDEVDKPDARYHFRGSVAMYHDRNEKNIGASMFSIDLVPATQKRPYKTVFGRVVSGMDVVEQLQVTSLPNNDGTVETLDDNVWDSIISAKVLRKRDHEYVPHIVKQ